jgi:hypothetical protein
VAVYVEALEAARRLHVRNEWAWKVGESRARYRPGEYPMLKDAKARLVEHDLSPAAFADTPEGPSRREPAAPAAAGAAAAPRAGHDGR